jgi:hypothetical protein
VKTHPRGASSYPTPVARQSDFSTYERPGSCCQPFSAPTRETPKSDAMAGSPELRDGLDSATTPGAGLMTTSDIELLFRNSPRLQSRGDEDAESKIADEELTQRVGELGRVLATVRKLFEAGSEDLDVLAQKIGDGSRDGKSEVLHGPEKPIYCPAYIGPQRHGR